MIDREDVTLLLVKHHRRFHWLTGKYCAVYDAPHGDSRVHIEICNNGRDISYAGKIIGGLDELENYL